MAPFAFLQNYLFIPAKFVHSNQIPNLQPYFVSVKIQYLYLEVSCDGSFVVVVESITHKTIND